MSTFNFWEYHFPMKTLYSACMEPVCKKHHITRTELDILLFLANNPEHDTATDIIEIRRLTKSHVSISIKALEQGGFLKKFYLPGNKKTAHLSVCQEADPLIAHGRQAQEHFCQILFDGLNRKEIEIMQQCFCRIHSNIKNYLEVYDL